MESKIPKPEELSDAEAESLLKYLTNTEYRRKTLLELLMGIHETRLDILINEWVKKERSHKQKETEK